MKILISIPFGSKQADKAKRRSAKQARRKDRKQEKRTIAKSDEQSRPSKEVQEHTSWHKVPRRKQERKVPASKWRISEAVGGRMLRIDPLISPEEE